MSPIELEMYRANTKAFIDADPIDVALIPHLKVKDHNGTKLTAQAPRGLQTVRLIPINDITPEVITPDGVQLTPTFVLLLEWNANVDRWDKFSLLGREFQVISPIRPRHSLGAYELKGDVAISG